MPGSLNCTFWCLYCFIQAESAAKPATLRILVLQGIARLATLGSLVRGLYSLLYKNVAFEMNLRSSGSVSRLIGLPLSDIVFVLTPSCQ
jgi:hypothetical protein